MDHEKQDTGDSDGMTGITLGDIISSLAQGKTVPGSCSGRTRSTTHGRAHEIIDYITGNRNDLRKLVILQKSRMVPSRHRLSSVAKGGLASGTDSDSDSDSESDSDCQGSSDEEGEDKQDTHTKEVGDRLTGEGSHQEERHRQNRLSYSDSTSQCLVKVVADPDLALNTLLSLDLH